MPEMSLEKIDEIIECSLQLAKDRLNTYIRRFKGKTNTR